MPSFRRRLAGNSHRLAAAALSVVLLAAVFAVLNVAEAAAPAAGTVSDASRMVAWKGGPFLVPNQTNVLDAPDCTAPGTCDDFALTVTTPAGYENTHNLVITVTWPTTTADFDVYLVRNDGSIIASSAGASDPEVIMQGVKAGKYTVRVVPYLPLGDSYSATAELKDVAAGPGTPGTGPGPGPVSTETAPGFTDYSPPSTADFSGAGDAGEPSIGNNFKTGATMYQAGLDTYKATFDDSVTPAKATWANVSASATTGCPAGSTTSLDPILFTDHVTGRTFESQLTGVDSATCYTDNDGTSWSTSTGGGAPSGVDHQTIGGGALAAGAPTLPTSTYAGSVYYCSQSIAAAFCAASLDGGTTFGAGVPTYSLLDCVGLHGHIRVAPDGTAYLPNKGCTNTDGSSQQAAVVTEDGGLSYEVRRVPGTTEGESDPSVSVGRNGTAYFGYVGADGLPGVATSADKGKTWANLQTVGKEFSIKNAVFPTIIAGDDDRAAFAYLGTPTPGASGATGVFDGVWHLYVDYTYDGGKTWKTSDATPGDPVQRGSICTAGTTCGDDRNLLDFIDITTDDTGRVLVGFADGCIAACVTDQTDPTNASADPAYHAAYTTIARQASGKPLFAKSVTTPPSSTPPSSTPPSSTPPSSTPPSSTPPSSTPPSSTPPSSTPPSSTPPTTAQPTTAPPTTTPPLLDTAPVARAAASPAVVRNKQQVVLSAIGTTDNETPASQLTYAWNFGNSPGTVDATGPVVATSYLKRGTRTATVTVTDPQGLKDTETVDITVQRRRACETSRFVKRGPWRLLHRGGDHSKHCDNLGKRKRGAARDRVDLTFDGTSVVLGYGRVRGGGSATVLLDGAKVGTISFRSSRAKLSFRASSTYDGLSSGKHRLSLRVKGRAYLDYAQY